MQAKFKVAIPLLFYLQHISRFYDFNHLPQIMLHVVIYPLQISGRELKLVKRLKLNNLGVKLKILSFALLKKKGHGLAVGFCHVPS